MALGRKIGKISATAVNGAPDLPPIGVSMPAGIEMLAKNSRRSALCNQLQGAG
jgi:hypothetical protein